MTERRNFDNTEIFYKLGEIQGTTNQIMRILGENKAALENQNKKIDDMEHRVDERLTSAEQEIVRTKGMFKGVTASIALIVPLFDNVLKKVGLL